MKRLWLTHQNRKLSDKEGGGIQAAETTKILHKYSPQVTSSLLLGLVSEEWRTHSLARAGGRAALWWETPGSWSHCLTLNKDSLMQQLCRFGHSGKPIIATPFSLSCWEDWRANTWKEHRTSLAYKKVSYFYYTSIIDSNCFHWTSNSNNIFESKNP